MSKSSIFDREIAGRAAAYGAVAIALTACAAYQPGSFTNGSRVFQGERVQVGCLDLAVARRPDHGVSPVLDFQFGNRCTRAEIVDLAFANVVGRTTQGNVRLAPYDPRGQLMALKLDGRYAGSEVLAYSSADPTYEGTGTFGQVCVDVASLVQQKPARWLCFDRIDQSGEKYTGGDVDDAKVVPVEDDESTEPTTEQPAEEPKP